MLTKRIAIALAATALFLAAPRVARADGGYLGVYIVDESEQKDGALVEDVEGRSPAEKAGIKKNDVIVGFDAHKVQNGHQLIEHLLKASPGEKHVLRMSREGWEREVGITFGKREGGAPSKKEEQPSTGPADGDRGFLGVRLKQNPEGPGAFVEGVEAASPAEKGGLKKGDIIVGCDGKKIDEYAALIELIRSARIGQRIKMRVAREGWERDVECVLGARPAGATPPPAVGPAKAVDPPSPSKKKAAFLGVALLDNDSKGPCKIDEIQAGSPAEKAGLKAGDVVIAVADKTVKSIAEFESVLQGKFAGDEIVVTVERDGWRRQVKVTLGERQD